MKTKSLFIFPLLLIFLTSCGAASIATDSSNDNRNPDIVAVYELYRSNGGTLTYEEWLESIKGEKGDKGDTGEKGDKGEAGKDGTSLLTGDGWPISSEGHNGDSYIDLNTWDFYVKVAGEWIKKGNLKLDHDNVFPEEINYYFAKDGKLYKTIPDSWIIPGTGEEYVCLSFKDNVLTKTYGGTISPILIDVYYVGNNHAFPVYKSQKHNNNEHGRDQSYTVDREMLIVQQSWSSSGIQQAYYYSEEYAIKNNLLIV